MIVGAGCQSLSRSQPQFRFCESLWFAKSLDAIPNLYMRVVVCGSTIIRRPQPRALLKADAAWSSCKANAIDGESLVYRTLLYIRIDDDCKYRQHQEQLVIVSVGEDSAPDSATH